VLLGAGSLAWRREGSDRKDHGPASEGGSVRLRDKVAVITGGATGIGRGTALLFGREGARVVVADIDEERGRRTADEIVAAGGDARFVKLDVTSEGDWDRVARQVVEWFGRVDILFNNAGIVILKMLEEMTLEDWNRTMTVNVTGMFLGLRAIVPIMAKQGGGSVINTSSDSGFVGFPGLCAYGASKGAVRLLTKHIAIEFAGRGVRVNSIHPSYVDTEMAAYVADTLEASSAEMEGYAPLGRVCRVEEVASLVTFLASDEASYCTGAEFLIDGGATAQ